MKRLIECYLIVISGCVFCNAKQSISPGGGEATGNLALAAYYLRISENQQEVKPFIIIKN